MSHANAALTPRARLRLAQLVVEAGRCCGRRALWWPGRRREVGRALPQRGPRPGWPIAVEAASLPDRDQPAGDAQIVDLVEKRLRPGPDRRQTRHGASTVHAVLVRCRINRLSHIDRRTGEPIRRYEHDHPGALDPRRREEARQHPRRRRLAFVGRAQGNRNRSRPPAEPATRSSAENRHPRIGTAFVHTVIDDHSRSRLRRDRTDEKAATAIGVLRRAVAWFAERGVTVERVLSDNGSAYRSYLWRDACAELRHHPQADPALPAPDQRQDRTIPPHPRRRLGLRPALQSEPHSATRSAELAALLQPPPGPLRHRKRPPITRLTNLPGHHI